MLTIFLLFENVPEYCDTKTPPAYSKVLVRRSSKEAKPNQYFWLLRSAGPRLLLANDAV